MRAEEPCIGAPLGGAWEAGRALASWPFDLLRAQHADAVRAGLLPRSLLESRDFEHSVDTMERVALGPLARRV